MVNSHLPIFPIATDKLTIDKFFCDLRQGFVMRAIINGLGIVQALLGVLGFYGVYLYLVEPTSNNSRYQCLFIPVWCFLFALPLLIIAAVLYRRGNVTMSLLERWVFNIGCLLPIAAFGFSISVSLLGW